MFREIFRRTTDALISSEPSPAYQEFINSTYRGESKFLPAVPQPFFFDYYGKNKEDVEQGRYRIMRDTLEKSYHIALGPDGKFVITDEGIFPTLKRSSLSEYGLTRDVQAFVVNLDKKQNHFF